jgi:DNA-binding ferritin-like protein (Dps family)
MSKILDSIKRSVKEKALEEAFKSDDGVSEVAEPAFDKRKNVPTKKDLKKTGPDLPGDVDNVSADNSKIEAGKDKAKGDNTKDINHKKYTQKNKASVIGEDFGKDKNKMVSDDDQDDDNQSDDQDDDNDADDNAGKEVAIKKPSDSGSDDDDSSDDDNGQEVDIKVRKVTKEDLDVSEHLAALFGKEDLSESFKSKSKNIFETAVVAAANEVISEVIEQILEANATEQEQFIDAMVEQMDSYLDKVVSEWLEENRVEVQSNVRTEIAESFLAGLKTLFEDHYIDIPEDKVEVVTELVAKVEALEASLDEEINKNVALASELIESKKEQLVTEHVEGLSDNQKERLRMLAEGIDFESEDDFVSQIEELKESYFNTEVKKTSIDSDDEPVVLQEEVEGKTASKSPIGDVIAQSISKSIRKIR